MRVLMLHSRYRWPGGEETTVDRITDVLRGGGHEVVLHDVENPAGAIQSIGSLAVAPWNHSQYRKVLDLIDGFRPDVAHVHNTWFSLSPSVIKACTSRQVPMVATIQNYRSVCPEAHLFRNSAVCTDCVGRVPFPGIRHRCYRDSAVITTINVATTRLHSRLNTWESLKLVHVPAEFARQVISNGPLSSSSFTTFPNAVPDPGPRPAPPSASDEVLFVGRLSQEKGLDLVLDAWEKDPPQGLRLSILGDGPDRQLWESRSVERVEFVGHQSPDDVRKRLLSARALVFPSRWYEVCPMVVIEALSAGLPVVAHDLGATPELIPDESKRSLIEFGDVQGWTYALNSFTDDALVDWLGAVNRRGYEERHTIGQWLTNHESMYQAAMAAS